MSIKITLFQYWKQKEIELGRSISVTEVARQTGVSRSTLTRLRAGNVTRADWEIVDKLCKFFNVPPGSVPFVVFEPD